MNNNNDNNNNDRYSINYFAKKTLEILEPYSPRFLHAMLFLDFTLSVIESEFRYGYLLDTARSHNQEEEEEEEEESELRIVYFCRNRAKEARSRRQFQIY